MKTKNKIPLKSFFAVVIALFLALGCSTTSKNQPPRNLSSTQSEMLQGKSTHYIVTIHGIGGDDKTFGFFNDVVSSHLSSLRPNENLEFRNFVYPTGKSNLDTFDYAIDYFNDFLEKNIPNLQDNDKISLVAHSQGGLIATIWYTSTLLALDRNGVRAERLVKFQKYSKATKTVITLGTPFWGSKLATLMLYEKGLDIEKIPFLAKMLSMGIDELKEMSFVSDTIHLFRTATIALNNNKEFDNLVFPQFINIAGVFPRDPKKLFYSREQVPEAKGINFGIVEKIVKFLNSTFEKKSFSSEKIKKSETDSDQSEVDRSESDIAVIVPSGRSEFLYAKKEVTCEKNKASKDGQHVLFGSSFESARIFNRAKYIATESIHMPLANSRTVGIADIPQFCKDPATCVHPAYRYLLSALANCEQSRCETEAKTNILDKMFDVNSNDTRINSQLSKGDDLQGFAIEFSIQLPDDYQLPITLLEQALPVNEASSNAVWRTSQSRNAIFSIVKQDQNKLSTLNSNQNSMFEIKLARKSEWFSSIMQVRESTFKNERRRDLRIHLTGIAKPKSLDILNERSNDISQLKKDGLIIPLEVQLPNQLHLDKENKNAKITVFAKVKPGFSTFVELDFRNGINCTNE